MYVCFNLFYAIACALNSALVDIMYVLINLLIIAAFYICCSTYVCRKIALRANVVCYMKTDVK